MIMCIQVIAPTAEQSYVEVNDMKHYSDVLTGTKMDGGEENDH